MYNHPKSHQHQMTPEKKTIFLPMQKTKSKYSTKETLFTKSIARNATVYIGQTKNRLSSRIKQTQTGYKTSKLQFHTFDFENAKILEKKENLNKRLIKENTPQRT